MRRAKSERTFFIKPMRIFLAILGIFAIFFSFFANDSAFGIVFAIPFALIPVAILRDLFWERGKSFFAIANFFTALIFASFALYIAVQLKLNLHRESFFEGVFIFVYTLNLFKQQIVGATEGIILALRRKIV